jgi:hypothetical protein
MTRGPKANPTCVGCNRTHEESEGIIAIHKGGMPTWLCFGCIDGLKLIVDAARRDASGGTPSTKVMPLATASGPYPEDAHGKS